MNSLGDCSSILHQSNLIMFMEIYRGKYLPLGAIIMIRIFKFQVLVINREQGQQEYDFR